MNDKEQARVLAVCLEAIAAGDTVAVCLARYPKQANELAPMLGAAFELRILGQYGLTGAARARARARLRQARAARSRPAATARAWPLRGGLLGARALAGLAMAVMCLVLLASMVAASQPGDLAYGARVVAERVPVWLAPGTEARLRGELALADRRLADVQESLSHRRGGETVALNALLASEDAAAGVAAGLSRAEQALVAARITAQARMLDQLSQSATPGAGTEALRLAAAHAHRAAERARPREAPEQPNRQATPWRRGIAPTVPVSGPTHTPAATRTPARTPYATAAAAPVAPPPTRTRVHVTGQPASVTPAARQGSRQPQATGTRPSTSSAGPDATRGQGTPGATALAPVSGPTSPGLGPNPTSPGPNPEPTSPGPGSAPEPAATSSGPGPGPRSPNPSGNQTSPGPGSSPPDPGGSQTSPGSGSGSASGPRH